MKIAFLILSIFYFVVYRLLLWSNFWCTTIHSPNDIINSDTQCLIILFTSCFLVSAVSPHKMHNAAYIFNFDYHHYYFFLFFFFVFFYCRQRWRSHYIIWFVVFCLKAKCCGTLAVEIWCSIVLFRVMHWACRGGEGDRNIIHSMFVSHTDVFFWFSVYVRQLQHNLVRVYSVIVICM